jgi:thioredoxin reductase (NADPH)
MGTIPRKLGCPGETEYWGKGVTTCAVCDGAFYVDKPVIIVGGGDSAMEEASFMTKFTKQITIVHILDKLTASYAMQKRVIDNPNIKIIYNSTISSIEGDGNHITHAVITNKKTNEAQKINTDAIFIAIGLTPKTEFLKGIVELNSYGYIVLQDHKAQTSTSVEGIFAAGDVADPVYRQAIAAAGTGCMAAIDVEAHLKNLGV